MFSTPARDRVDAPLQYAYRPPVTIFDVLCDVGFPRSRPQDLFAVRMSSFFLMSMVIEGVVFGDRLALARVANSGAFMLYVSLSSG